jgi:hypothetical protein
MNVISGCHPGRFLRTGLHLSIAVLPCLPGIAAAAPFDQKPKLLLHAAAVVSKNACEQAPLDCASAVTSAATALGAAGPFYNVYLLAAKGSLASSTGFSCGVYYAGGDPNGDSDGVGIEVFAWEYCGTGFSLPSVPPWPKPTGVTLRYWDTEYSCNAAEVQVAGYFYMGAYAPDTLALGVRQLGMSAVMLGCPDTQENKLGPEDLGSIVFSPGGTVPGCNPCVTPCASVPVVPQSWSRIKTLVGQARGN